MRCKMPDVHDDPDQIKRRIDQELEALKSGIFHDLARALQEAWPDEQIVWSKSPVELISILIAERDTWELRARRLRWGNKW